MSPDKDRQLCEKYPDIFADRHGDPTRTCMCWGFECGDGWFDIIDVLCAQLEQHVKSDPNARPIKAIQVKEKFGGLRFYCVSSSPVVDSLINFASHLSHRVCEGCGNPGRPRGSGWIKTQCDSCASRAT